MESKAEKEKTAYIHIAVSVLPIVITLATGFISITNNITMLTTKDRIQLSGWMRIGMAIVSLCQYVFVP